MNGSNFIQRALYKKQSVVCRRNVHQHPVWGHTDAVDGSNWVNVQHPHKIGPRKSLVRKTKALDTCSPDNGWALQYVA